MAYIIMFKSHRETGSACIGPVPVLVKLCICIRGTWLKSWPVCQVSWFFREFRANNVLRVRWLYVGTSGSYPRGLSQSEVSYEHSPIVSGYGATNIWNSRSSEPFVQDRGHSWVWQYRKFNDIVPSSCLICVRTPFFQVIVYMKM
jgi:hypothetical protein